MYKLNQKPIIGDRLKKQNTSTSQKIVSRVTKNLLYKNNTFFARLRI